MVGHWRMRAEARSRDGELLGEQCEKACMENSALLVLLVKCILRNHKKFHEFKSSGSSQFSFWGSSTSFGERDGLELVEGT